MAKRELQTLIFDLESNGLLPRMDKIHCLAIREYETGQVWRFRNNKKGNNIAKGVEMLMKAKVIVGHNIINFDIPAIQLIYPDFDPKALVEDTLVYSGLLFAGQKDKDFDLWRSGGLPGGLIGSHSLEAWGHRLHLHKGDYTKMMLAKAKALGITDKVEAMDFVWAVWNPEMDDYCLNDIDVTTKFWAHCLMQRFPQGPIDFEHEFHEFACQLSRNGFPFDIEGAEKIVTEMRGESDVLVEDAKAHYGIWFAPGKKRITSMLWDDPDGKNEKKAYANPRAKYGEDHSRSIWAEVDTAKRSAISKETYKHRKVKKTGETITTLNYDRFKDAPSCKVQLKEFKPTSRQMIVDRFTTVYKWEPKEFTEKGSPSVNDVVLRNLIGKVPMAEELAEIFYFAKRIGMIATGPQAWLKKVEADGAIHHRLNGGGTVSGRCSHSFPNLGQVPSVEVVPVIMKDGSLNPKVLNKHGEPFRDCFDDNGGHNKTIILKGRLGNHGFDCRSLFYVPPGWRLVGCDLSGIELRCLANLAAPFDGGFLIRQILEGDIHETNREAAGLATRDQAKTFIYALVYGAGDVKIGSIVDPMADEETQRQIGKDLKAKFFARLPGLAAAVKKIKREAARGFIIGLDGRKLFVRSPHSALNLRLQSDGAVIAKRWSLMSVDKFYDAGYEEGWAGDFAFLAFVHDENQVAVRDGMEGFAKKSMIDAAKEAGVFYDFAMDVDAEAKDGVNWAQTH